jgi:hypothetical protein
VTLRLLPPSELTAQDLRW